MVPTADLLGDLLGGALPEGVLEGEGCAGLRFAYASCRVAWHIIFAASALLAVMAPSPRRALLRLWLVLRVSFPTQLMLPTNHAFLWGGWGDWRGV